MPLVEESNKSWDSSVPKTKVEQRLTLSSLLGKLTSLITPM